MANRAGTRQTGDGRPESAAGAAAAAVLDRAVLARIFPAAVAEVGNSSGTLWREPFGTLSFEPGAPATEETTIFDLASLTKPIATTSVVMDLVARGTLAIEEPISAFFDDWRGRDREAVTIQDLLEHTSGLAARLVDRPSGHRREFEHDICTMPLEYHPRTASVYSDLGFILLGFLTADQGNTALATLFELVVAPVLRVVARAPEALEPFDGTATPSDVRVSRIAETIVGHPDLLAFAPPPALRSRTAPTCPLDDDPRQGRVLSGEVHDSYAAALGGVAGHAGLFGTAAAVGDFGRAALRGARGDPSIPSPLSASLVARATRKSSVPASSRALGWDTMLPTSSCGTQMSPAAFGHVGFTGCSLWIDPQRDRYVALLTNRANGGGTVEQMRAVRREFHDALAGI